MSKPPEPSVQTPETPSVVIVGGGMVGIQAAKTLAKTPVEVTLVDTRYYYLFQPLIYDVANALLNVDGSDTIPALVLENGSVVVGEDEIVAYLDQHCRESADAGAHRVKAAKARRRYLEEECACSPLATR